MPMLDRAWRGQLERSLAKARHISEKAALAALEQLGVNQKERPSWLDEQADRLRLALRAHGRQLGDALNGASGQTMSRLVEETAYAHWHRMLFARFLAENGLLMYVEPDDAANPTPISIAECMELAAEPEVASVWHVSNGWELAARLAARQLPQIFNVDSPVLRLNFAPEDQQKLERLLANLPVELFTASDSLGWVYQFWQDEARDAVNRAEIKIGARELPAVTQLFTESYMVDFLLDNSLGAWLAARQLTEPDYQTAGNEEELRQKAALPGLPLSFLRFVETESGWRIAAGAFPEWPESLADFRMLDPCCGSGHFLVSALRMLAAMRMRLDDLPAREAVAAVLEQNLFALELDERCVSLAACALAFAAWTWTPPGAEKPLGFFPLPRLNIACPGTRVTADREKWTAIAPPNSPLRNALALLHEEFRSAPVLGSLIEPENIEAAPDPRELRNALAKALAHEDADELRETAVAAAGISLATEMLGRKYTLVATNVPYLARGKQSDKLKDYCERKFPLARQDLATVFLQRCLKLCQNGGVCALVMPQNWLFLGSYKKLREALLRHDSWKLLARLGAKSFQTPMWDFNVQLFIISNLQPDQDKPLLEEKAAPHLMSGLDVSALPNAEAKALALQNAAITEIEQAKQLENPDCRVAFGNVGGELLGKYAQSFKGITASDTPRFCHYFWELPNLPQEWSFWQSTTADNEFYSGRTLCLWLKEVEIKAEKDGTAYIRGRKTWGKSSVAISEMGDLPATLGTGAPTDTNVALLLPHDPAHLPAIWRFCSSPEYNEAVRQIDQALKVTNATLVKVPFDLERWQKEADEKYPNGLPRPYSNNPTQWIFHGHPARTAVWNEEAKATANGPLRYDAAALQIGLARLLGYRWPAEQDANMELAPEQAALARECEKLGQFADAEGIVCIPPIGGGQPAASRLLDLLAAAYGENWSGNVLQRLLADAGFAGKTLEAFLRDGFFVQHCRLFRNRPFIWQVWDGLADGFSALLNYHKLDYKNLENLAYSYLGDWIRRQNQGKNAGVPGTPEKLAAAQNLQERLKEILKGETPLDIFVRWKPLAEQPKGWHPDLNDGVRLNIRPFMSCADIGKKKGAGILREKPNIKWEKDRGKDLASAPWHSLFHGERINDWHLSLAEKEGSNQE